MADRSDIANDSYFQAYSPSKTRENSKFPNCSRVTAKRFSYCYFLCCIWYFKPKSYVSVDFCVNEILTNPPALEKLSN